MDVPWIYRHSTMDVGWRFAQKKTPHKAGSDSCHAIGAEC
jgi:hypothetical protein